MGPAWVCGSVHAIECGGGPADLRGVGKGTGPRRRQGAATSRALRDIGRQPAPLRAAPASAPTAAIAVAAAVSALQVGGCWESEVDSVGGERCRSPGPAMAHMPAAHCARMPTRMMADKGPPPQPEAVPPVPSRRIPESSDFRVAGSVAAPLPRTRAAPLARACRCRLGRPSRRHGCPSRRRGRPSRWRGRPRPLGPGRSAPARAPRGPAANLFFDAVRFLWLLWR
jgi:hypothetical protein